MDQLKTAIDQIGLTKLADALGVSPQRLSNWQERGVPLEFCAPMETATNGLFLRKAYREDWASIWPELVEKTTV